MYGYQPNTYGLNYNSNAYTQAQLYNPYGYSNNYQQLQNNMQGMLNQNPNMTGQTSELLQGTVVDSIDVVRARNCNLDGTPSYYPKSDKTEIYCKQLNPQTGAGVILTYRLVPEELSNAKDVKDTKDNQRDEDMNIFSSTLNDLKKDVSELKNLLLDNLTRPSFVKDGDDK